MSYRYALRGADHSDLAGGLVLRSAPGMPGFPVRLADEIFQRADALLPGSHPRSVWDPCCGGGYLLAVLGMLHPRRVTALLGSDVDERALSVAEANLELLTVGGLTERGRRLRELADSYGKASHAEAERAAGRLLERIRELDHPVRTAAGWADVFDVDGLRAVLGEESPDLVITDVPYGDLTSWQGASGIEEPLPAVIRNLAAVLPARSVLAVTCRARRVPLGGAGALSTLKVGHRSVAFLRAGDVLG